MKEDMKDFAGCSFGCFALIIATLVAINLVVLGIKSAIWIWIL